MGPDDAGVLRRDRVVEERSVGEAGSRAGIERVEAEVGPGAVGVEVGLRPVVLVEQVPDLRGPPGQVIRPARLLARGGSTPVRA